MFTGLSDGTPASGTVLVGVEGALGRLHLNRPEALNSLDLDMVRKIAGEVDALESNPAVRAIALTGEGRALCAGGDIKMIWQTGRTAPQEALAFWAEEYRLNARISHMRKPWLALMDGICMGGGVGLSVHGSHRIVTERTRFAMPETGIGYFPDVGGTWALARAPQHLGFWIGLTGASIGAADTIAAGLADAMVPSASIPALLSDIGSGRTVDAALDAYSAPPGPSVLAEQADLIDRIFRIPDICGIFAALRADGSDFAATTLAQLETKSPTSLVLTLYLLREAERSTSLEACLDREYAADAAILAGHDFYEGVRAAVIDKDRNPVWKPARLEDVDQRALVAAISPRPSLFA
ncbi:enoyl-CoA hydratase/isomerase family protein [Allorhizobium sp. BGMRC 0089]|uniref:enoyl-CoA hydratase/isomerase family protein n=1 Tax=Allorhizobium sonneratiae TaxID=2934936 RepID=UPI002033B3B8|nr:enoyl-CoA hydratase/isomerase family protein [Allorhizobium sonneratiae]MCM2293958.1 enoyl-CoA hydratase/isomerase family protein [Allorhizobium sonneratiae]